MKKNIGQIDRIARIIIGFVAISLGIFQSSGFLILIGAFSIFEALVGWCAFYQLIGVNTCPVKKRAPFPFALLFQNLATGVSILTVAIFLNVVAQIVGWKTWYVLLGNIASGSFTALQTYTIDNWIFLFVVYPLGLGIVAQKAILFIHNKIKVVD
jgi:hypothetical protein